MEVTNDIDLKIMERLRNLEEGEGEFSRLAKVYRELLNIQMEAKFHAAVVRPDLGKEQVKDRLREGIPLLLFEDVCTDWNHVQTVFKQIIAWSAVDSEAPYEEHENLRNMGSKPNFLREAAEAWYRGLSIKTLPVAQSIDAELLTSVIGTTLKPFLSAYSSLLLPEVDQELWRRKYCPICGGKPDFSSLKEGGARWLFCSRCDGEWLFSRIECPYCGTKDQNTLAYLTDEASSGLYRLYICEECHTYMKAIDLRISGAEVLLPLERVLTLDLDRQGRQKGYEPGWTTWKCYDGFNHVPAEEERERREN
jgi:FdhE protein